MNQYGKQLVLCLGRTIPLSNTLGTIFKCKYNVLIKFKEVIHFFPPSQSPKKYHEVLLNLLAFFLK